MQLCDLIWTGAHCSVSEQLSPGFFGEFKESVFASGHLCGPRLPELYAPARGRGICAPWFWCLSFTDLLVTFVFISASHPKANIKCNRSQVYLSKPTQKSEDFLGDSAVGSQRLPSGKKNKKVVFVFQFLKNQKIDHKWTEVLSEYGEAGEGK